MYDFVFKEYTINSTIQITTLLPSVKVIAQGTAIQYKLQYKFIAKSQGYCTRNVSWCKVLSLTHS